MPNYPFLDSDVPEPEGPHFEALGHAGSDHYVGLETFDNPGCMLVQYASDELVAFCPITKQPDFYEMTLTLMNTEKCIESKSLKLWLRQFNTPENGLFCEALAVFIRDQVGQVLELDEEDTMKQVQIILMQKSRGGIEIKATA